ncbi:MAG: hypothetical protein HOE11_02330 [Candidatus Diapherotrites archaeon]|nr:hypothetical protein [Candidatus Diapherotrites archaeon]MBT4596967.1 hypothetical protein [Candidatus Diapherotrites archaeon]
MVKRKPRLKKKTSVKKAKVKTHKFSDTLIKEEKFLKKYPGFTIAIIFIIIVIALLAIVISVGGSSGEELAQGRMMHEENALYLDDLITGFEEQEIAFENPLDDDYYYSIRDDFYWLKNKESSIYNSFPANEIYLKEMAFTVFMDLILQTNLDFTFELFEEDYDSAINDALTKELGIENFVVTSEIEELFEGAEYEKSVFENSLNGLIDEYVSLKTNILKGDVSSERKFVEAKKIIFISFE